MTQAPGEIGLFDYLAVCWARRWRILAATVLPVVVAGALLAARPARWEAEATLAATPASFGARIVLIVVWKVLPDGVLRAGEEIEAERRDELVRVRLRAPDSEAAQAALARFVTWMDGERRQPELMPRAPKKVKAPPPDPKAAAAWRAQVGEIEARLGELPATASPYWTSRALALQGRLEALGTPEPPEPPDPPEPRPERGEEAVVLQRRPVRRFPDPWLPALVSAAVGGFVMLGVFGALVEEWWRRESARRGAA